MLLLQGRDQCSEESFFTLALVGRFRCSFPTSDSGVQTAHNQRLSSVKEEAENKQTVIDEEEDY